MVIIKKLINERKPYVFTCVTCGQAVRALSMAPVVCPYCKKIMPAFEYLRDNAKDRLRYHFLGRISGYKINDELKPKEHLFIVTAFAMEFGLRTKKQFKMEADKASEVHDFMRENYPKLFGVTVERIME